MSRTTSSISPSSSSSKPATKPGVGVESPNAQSRPRRTRVVRRRGRGRLDGIESDEEIERAALSDESDSDGPSLLDSASDTEAESESESVLLRSGHAHPDTPSTTQSPPPGEVEARAALEGFAAAKAEQPESESGTLQPPHSAPAFLSAGVDWSDMVTDEGTNGVAELPVIDFADLHEHTHDEPPPIALQEVESGPSTVDQGEHESDAPHEVERPRQGGSSGAHLPPRVAGQTARQAYQQRLQADPSFVPIVGEFWGHDDRLLQKDLRSLSGWWRGRWQGRGRGRGGFVGRGMRGRGRGGFFGGPSHQSQSGEEAGQDESAQPTEEELTPEPELPPIEKEWTHDGYEEMKARDEKRRSEQQRAARPVQTFSSNGVPNGQFRGGFAPRARGAFAARRGAFSPSHSRPGPPYSYHNARSTPDRTWYAMKPERIWTKQYEGFLYSDPALKPKFGKSAGYRVSLPGKGTEVIRVTFETSKVEPVAIQSQAPSESATESGKTYTVKVPKKSAMDRKEDAFSQAKVAEVQPEAFTTIEELPSEPPAPVAAPLASTSTVPPPPVAPTSSMTEAFVPQSSFLPPGLDQLATPSLTRENSLSERSLSEIPTIIPQAEPLSNGDSKGETERAHVGQLPPLQTAFPPPAQPSPTYGSPYGFPSLPPGIALSQQGFAYEIASGRPVYLHPTPPPPIPIYNPRPIPHTHGVFVPGHMHHPSLTADFMQAQAPHTPPIGGFLDPTTGQPLFSLPRQSSRVEIRAPTDSTEGKGKAERRPSNLRSTTVIEPSRPAPPPSLAQYVSAPEYFPDMSGGPPLQTYQPSEGAASASPGREDGVLAPQPVMDPAMMGYPPFQQQYYYPEQFYPAYLEMPQQSGQYDPYVSDPHRQQPVYY